MGHADSNIENTIIELPSEDGPIQLIAAYNLPNNAIQSTDLDALMPPNSRTVVIGDLNAKHVAWGCHNSNRSGRTILNYFENNDIMIHAPTSPTHYSANGRPEILDIVLTKNYDPDLDLTVVSDLSSDHDPITIKIETQIQPRPQKTLNITNWPKFTAYMFLNTPPYCPSTQHRR